MARVRGELVWAWYPVPTNKGWRWLQWVFRDTIEYENGEVTRRYHAV